MTAQNKTAYSSVDFVKDDKLLLRVFVTVLYVACTRDNVMRDLCYHRSFLISRLLALGTVSMKM